MNSHSGGAQYLMKNVNQYYWQKVETDCELLHRDITKLNVEKNKLESELDMSVQNLYADFDLDQLHFMGRKKCPDCSQAVGAGQSNGFAYVDAQLRK